MTLKPPSKPGDRDPIIREAREALGRFGYASFLESEPIDDPDIYTDGFGDALRAYARATNNHVRTGQRSGPYVTTSGAFDWTVCVQLGLYSVPTLAPSQVAEEKSAATLDLPPRVYRPIYFFSAPGSGANNLIGPSNDVGIRVFDWLNINHRRLNFPIGGYLGALGGDASLSYLEVIAAEGADLELQLGQAIDESRERNSLNSIEFWFSGYSQSADGMKKAVVRLFQDGGRFAEFRSRINGLILFGDPSRAPGPVKRGAGREGYHPRGWGIARYDSPQWIDDLTWSITTDGDMYACTEDDTLLPGFYAWFVRAETTFSFVQFSAALIVPAIASYLNIFGPLLGGIFGSAGAVVIAGRAGISFSFLEAILRSGAIDDPEIVRLRNDLSAQGMLSTAGIAKLIRTLAALPGVDTHGRYGDRRPEFGDRSGLEVGYDIVAGFRR